MFKKISILASVVAILGAWSVNAQINLLSNSIIFRDNATAGNSTYHYGDLHLQGGNAGSSWGWFFANRIYCEGYGYISGDADIGGTLAIGGNLSVYGTKNFVQPHPTDSTKEIVYVAIEAGEALTLARGTATTINGEVTIPLPTDFSLVTSSDAPITVLITPKNSPALLYVKQESKDQITVAMKNTDFYEFRDVAFSYQVTGVRDGFENHQVIRDIDFTGKGDDLTNASPKRKAILEKVKNIMDKRKANMSKEKAKK